MHVTLGVLRKDATWAGVVHAVIDACARTRGVEAARCPAAARREVGGTDARTGLRWAELLHAAVSALTWSGERVALELRAALPMHAVGWADAPASAERLGALLRLAEQGGGGERRAGGAAGGIELSSSAFAWSQAAASSENGRADPHILRPRAGVWSAAAETPAGWRALDAELSARLGALAPEAVVLAPLGAATMARAHAERVRIRRLARRRDLEWHTQRPADN